jgi:hypothetical protein
MGINVKDHPNGIPHSDGNVMEKFANGNVTSSRDTPYKHQARDAAIRRGIIEVYNTDRCAEI